MGFAANAVVLISEHITAAAISFLFIIFSSILLIFSKNYIA